MTSSRAARATAYGALSALLLAALPLAAQQGDAPAFKWWKNPRAVQELRIQPDQQERLEQIFAKNRRAFIDLKAEVERRQLDLEELLSKKDSDPKRVAAAVDAAEQARLKLRKAHTMMQVEMREILTAEQWQRLMDAREQRQQRMQRRRPLLREGGKED